MKKLIVGNLKMNILSREERKIYFDILSKESKSRDFSEAEVVFCPPFVHLENFKNELPENFKLGAQNCFFEEKGSFTGEISPLMLKNIGCDFVILGHSERRKNQGETDEEIEKKVFLATKVSLMPIICVGENLEERMAGDFEKKIVAQVKGALAQMRPGLLEKVVVAYEPIWSIGSEKTPTANEIMEVKVLIRKTLVELFGKNFGEKPRIIYGGNVNQKTVEETCLKSGMDGVLVGRESLAPGEFLRIAEIINNK